MLEHGSDETDLGPEVCNCMLFVHAILGCDTTSSLYGIGKKIGLKLGKLFIEQALVFSKQTKTHADVVTAGQGIGANLQGYPR